MITLAFLIPIVSFVVLTYLVFHAPEISNEVID